MADQASLSLRRRLDIGRDPGLRAFASDKAVSWALPVSRRREGKLTRDNTERRLIRHPSKSGADASVAQTQHRQPDLDSTAITSRYDYSDATLPLGDKHIRLVSVQPGNNDDAIYCKLSLANLETLKETYTAVSYTWGLEGTNRIIWLNGKEFMVKQNLYAVLHTFRQSDQASMLWIDAICINQSSLKERNHQVKQMGEIFQKALRVNAWLGSADAASEKDFACIREIARIARDRPWPIPEDTVQQAQRTIILIQQERYWSRAWILQELVLAQDILFFWGSTSFTWSSLVCAIGMTKKELAPGIRAIAMTRVSEGEQPFEQLFDRFEHLECALPHDKFYSLHGIAGVGSNRGTSCFPAPDYNHCITEVFIQHLASLEERLPVQSPLPFVITFVKRFLHGDPHQNGCECHRRTLVKVRLPLRGTLSGGKPPTPTRPATSIRYSSYAPPPLAAWTPDFCVYREDYVYKFRRFDSTKECRFEVGDLAIDLGSELWNLVVRPREATSGRTSSGLQEMKAIGVVSFERQPSRCFSPTEALSEPAANSKLRLEQLEDVLTMQLEVETLLSFGRFLYQDQLRVNEGDGT